MREKPCLKTAAAAGPLVVALFFSAALLYLYPIAAALPLAAVVLLHLSPRHDHTSDRHTSHLHVLSANVLLSNKDPQRAISSLLKREPDVLFLIEATPEMLKYLPPKGTLSHFSDTECGLLGLAVWSPHPVSHTGFLAAGSRRFPIYKIDTPSSRWLASPVHLTAPNVASRRRFWSRQLDSLTVSLPRCTPDFIAGDFNASWCNPEFRRMCKKTGFIPSGSLVSRLLPSWGPAGLVSLLRLDHVLTRSGVTARSLRLVRVPHSDHRAVSVVLSRVPHSAEVRPKTQR